MNADGLFSGGDNRTYSLDRDDFIKELRKIFPGSCKDEPHIGPSCTAIK
jgi:hypothetical protein